MGQMTQKEFKIAGISVKKINGKILHATIILGCKRSLTLYMCEVK